MELSKECPKCAEREAALKKFAYMIGLRRAAYLDNATIEKRAGNEPRAERLQLNATMMEVVLNDLGYLGLAPEEDATDGA